MKIKRNPLSARFHELLIELGTLHDQKQADYGNDSDPFSNIRSSVEWGIAPWTGALVRLNDKVRRLQKFAQKGVLANESAEDSMRDIAIYAIIALVLYEEESANRRGPSDDRPILGGETKTPETGAEDLNVKDPLQVGQPELHRLPLAKYVVCKWNGNDCVWEAVENYPNPNSIADATGDSSSHS